MYKLLSNEIALNSLEWALKQSKFQKDHDQSKMKDCLNTYCSAGLW